ncbi:bifunctional demethylmenaquinone methyltransferase/2-methoxy-6-polyprenyl-1,4-benzoquinol methylase UbiE [Salinispira pacifica]
MKDLDTLYRSVDVHDMFSRVVPTYDLLNHLFSFNVDRLWRSKIVRMARLPSEAHVLDVATGTADLAIAFARAHDDCRVVGVDFVEEMLVRGREKVARSGLGDRIELLHGDALSMPFDSDSFDVATIAFGLRNLNDFTGGIREMTRVVRPGGKVMVLEFSPPPPTLFGRIYNWYLRTVMPKLGGRVSGWEPTYGYLYSSINAFLDHKALADLMRSEGLDDIEMAKLSGGIAYIHAGVKRR